MSEQNPPHDATQEKEDPETGEPVSELADLAEAPGVDFVARIRNRIHRRSLGYQVADLSWNLPLVVMMEWLVFFMDCFLGGKAGGDDANG